VSTSALFLSPKGKVAFDTIITKIPLLPDEAGDEPGYFIDLANDQVDEFKMHLDKYKLRNKVTFENISDQLTIYATISNHAHPEEKEGQKISWTDSPDNADVDPEEMDNYAAAVDPRLKQMGTRTICVDGALEIEDDQSDINLASLREYDHLRILYGIPEGMPTVDRLPLNLNHHLLNGISFDKGCYIGQENVARHFYRGQRRNICYPFVIGHEG